MPPAALTPLLRRMNAESLKLFGNTSHNDPFLFIHDDKTSVKENRSVEALDVRSVAFAYGLLEPEDSGADADGSRLFRLSQLAVTRLQSSLLQLLPTLRRSVHDFFPPRALDFKKEEE